MQNQMKKGKKKLPQSSIIAEHLVQLHTETDLALLNNTGNEEYYQLNRLQDGNSAEEHYHLQT